ncbi:5'-methylthioadenosine/S-adenosylhomocysteine nucleosidase [Nonomuraea sp. CA-218870]|uniref:5'-methylthioadenosine/S-adenosylhomocysteine nucleosidase n=1 Tax=Nonomuraea sp. CA-218870 TaxID=3239998 RepID=UPI003D8C3593
MPEQIIVLTALEVEYNAVYQHLTELETDEHESGTTFEIGTMRGCPWQVVMAELGPGNLGAAVVTTQAIQRYSPRAVLMVGIAGSLAPDKVKQGDVVIGTKTYWYHSAKHEGERVLARPDSWPGSHRLLQRAKVVTRRKPWGQARFGVHTKPIASGEVVLNSADSSLKDQLRFHYNDAVAIEMESRPRESLHPRRPSHTTPVPMRDNDPFATLEDQIARTQKEVRRAFSHPAADDPLAALMGALDTLNGHLTNLIDLTSGEQRRAKGTRKVLLRDQ